MFTRPTRLVRFIFSLVFILSVLSAPEGMAAASADASSPPNLMQFTSGGHVLGFTPDGMYAASPSHALHVQFVGTNEVQPQARASASADVKAPPLEVVSYEDLWPGISLSYSAGGIYTTTYALAPGADPRDIRLLYNAPPSLNEDGSLSIVFETGALTESAPIAWQEIAGRRVPVEASFNVQGQMVSFALGAYDPRLALTIDPILNWNTFVGTDGDEQAYGIAIDVSGNLYVAGSGTAYAPGQIRPYTEKSDGTVIKLRPWGSLVWITFLGGNGDDYAYDIVVRGSNVYVAGESDLAWSCSATKDCTERDFTDDEDGFVAKLDTDGILIWNTFLGGAYKDTANGIAVGGDGYIYAAGLSTSAWGCTTGGGCTTRPYIGSGEDGYIAKLDSYGALTRNTYLGSYPPDTVNKIAVTDSVYAVGRSLGSWSCPTGCTVRAFLGGGYDYDGFVAKLALSDLSLTWNTFLGATSSADDATAIALDGFGNAYVVGSSGATWGSPLRTYKGGVDAFVARLAQSDLSLTWNSFLGSSSDERANGVATDADGSVYVTGNGYAVWGKPRRPYSGSGDGFATKLGPSGAIALNMFIGGSGTDFATDIVVDAARNGYIAGYSDTTWGSPLLPFNAGLDSFVAKTDFGLYVKSAALLDGWILESSESSGIGGTMNSSSTTLNVGDDAADKQYRAILSFYTGPLPNNAKINSVKLQIMRAGVVGSNPFTILGNLLADIRNGPFSGNKALQLSDFQASPSKAGALTFTDSPVADWYSQSLTASDFTYISRAGITQFRLRFTKDDNDNMSADYLKFYSGNASAAYRPLLVILFSVP